MKDWNILMPMFTAIVDDCAVFKMKSKSITVVVSKSLMTGTAEAFTGTWDYNAEDTYSELQARLWIYRDTFQDIVIELIRWYEHHYKWLHNSPTRYKEAYDLAQQLKPGETLRGRWANRATEFTAYRDITGARWVLRDTDGYKKQGDAELMTVGGINYWAIKIKTA